MVKTHSKKLLFSIILNILVIAAFSQVQARVTGVCSNCHTMHNSQGGSPMAQELSSGPWEWTDDTTPNPSLLIYSCVGCHTKVGSSTTIDNDVPIVFNTQSPTNPLAGGNFYYVINGGDNRGHNVVGIKALDGTLGITPPGGTIMSEQLTCAGQNGCHGDRGVSDQLGAIKNAHHTNDTGGITGESVGLSYRFLSGIEGVEDDDYEQETDADKNYYKGADNSDTDATTISYLCNNCHGDFHDRVKISDESTAATPWLRHPTDYLLPEDGEYGSYDPTATYENKAPVAWTDLSSRNRSTAVVMCLSCHRAHGSPYYKMIRWDNKANMSGCVVCHTSKD